MNPEELRALNDSIAQLHNDGDALNYEIDPENRIKFPRGFLRTLNTQRGFLNFIENDTLKSKIANHMMHRDTLHWLWLKTDVSANAREMVIKFQLINLASILEAIVKYLLPEMTGARDNVYDRIDDLKADNQIENGGDLKRLWAARKSIHLHLTGEVENIEFSDVNYRMWHESVSQLIVNLNEVN